MDDPWEHGGSSDHQPAVLDDLHCIGCGYALRGLSETGSCPECGTPVTDSVRGDLLRHADKAWVRRLRTGTLLLAIYALILVPAGVVNAGVQGVVMEFPDLQWAAHAINLLVTIATALLFLVGAFMVTTQEPRLRENEDPVTLRIVVRVTAVVGVGGGILAAIAEHDPFGDGGFALQIAGAVLSMAWVVTFFGMFVFYRRLGERVPDPALVRRTRITMWGMVVCYSLVIVFVGLAVMLATGVGMAAMMVPLLLMCGVGVGLLVFMVSTIVLLFKYYGAFGKALAAASGGADPSPPRINYLHPV